MTFGKILGVQKPVLSFVFVAVRLLLDEVMEIIKIQDLRISPANPHNSDGLQKIPHTPCTPSAPTGPPPLKCEDDLFC